jgi:hypothetical protein
MAFREKDYLKRQLAELARAIALALGHRQAGRPEEARVALEEGAAAALGASYAMLGAVDVATARGILRTRAGADGYAQLLECEAAIEEEGGDAARAESLQARARAMREGG